MFKETAVLTWERVNNWQKKNRRNLLVLNYLFPVANFRSNGWCIGLYLRHFRRLNLSRTSSSLSGKTLFLRLSRFQVATSLQLLVKWFKVLTLFSNAKTLSLKSSTVWVILNMATVTKHIAIRMNIRINVIALDSDCVFRIDRCSIDGWGLAGDLCFLGFFAAAAAAAGVCLGLKPLACKSWTSILTMS